MNKEDIENIIININYASGIYEKIYKLKSKLIKFQKILENEKKKLDNLIYGVIDIKEKVLIKRTFNQILDEICKENDIPREKIFIYFDEKILGGYFFRADETKVETIKKEINARGGFTFEFSIASNKDALEKEPLFCIYPLTNEEKNRRKRIEKLRENDLFYGEYRFDAKPFLPMQDGTMLYKSLKRESGISAEMAWFFNITKYENMYYYVEPKNIDLSDESILAKALKKLLTDAELIEYYEQKDRYEKLIEKRKQEIKKTENIIDDLKDNIKKLNIEIKKTSKQVQLLKWPIIKIRVGDFIDEIYKSDETIINSKNSELYFNGQKYRFNITNRSEDTFHLGILMFEKDALKFDVDFAWTMSYSDIMYNGKTLHQHIRRNGWKCIRKYKRMKDIKFYFNPIDFFGKMDGSITDSKDILSDYTIQKIVLKCIALEIARQEENPKSYANQIYEKYVKKLSVQNTNEGMSLDDLAGRETKTELTNKMSREYALKLVRSNCTNFKKLDIKYRCDRDIAMEAVVMDGLLLEYVSEKLKSDEVLVYAALKSDSRALEFASNKFKDDDKTVMYAVSRCGSTIKFASPRLKGDRNVVLEAVKQDGRAVLFLNEKIFSNKEIMLEVVSQIKSAYLIVFASELWDDMDVMKAAYGINKEYLKYASDRIKYEIGRLEDKRRIELIKLFTNGMLNNSETKLNQKQKTKTLKKF